MGCNIAQRVQCSSEGTVEHAVGCRVAQYGEAYSLAVCSELKGVAQLSRVHRSSEGCRVAH